MKKNAESYSIVDETFISHVGEKVFENKFFAGENLDVGFVSQSFDEYSLTVCLDIHVHFYTYNKIVYILWTCLNDTPISYKFDEKFDDQMISCDRQNDQTIDLNYGRLERFVFDRIDMKIQKDHDEINRGELYQIVYQIFVLLVKIKFDFP